MERKFSTLENEEGSALLIAMLVLTLLTLIGISAMTTTNVELQVAGNDKSHKIAFHNADSGIYAIPKLISQAIDEHATPYLGVTSAFTYHYPGSDDNDGTNGPTFYRELLYKQESYDNNNPDIQDIEFALVDSNSIGVDVSRIKAVSVIGGGAEFGSGYEGAGGSSKGVLYNLDSFGSGPNNAKSNIEAHYLKVLNAAGGM